MSSSPIDTRRDPLVDAYRQASALEALATNARPSAALRAAVLAHARVVAQSAATAEPKLAVSDAVRATPAANESKPVWRMVAGVVLGLAGMWVYQLTRPDSLGEANVAVMTAPQSAKSVATESAQSTVARTSPVAPVAPVSAGAPSPVAPASSTPAITGAPAQQETTVAVAALPKPALTPAPAARASSARERATATSNSAGVSEPRDGLAGAARSDQSVALATAETSRKRAEQSAPVAAEQTAPAAPVATAVASPAAVATTSAIPEVATSEPFGETAVAAAEMRKATRPSAVARTAAVAAPAAASPNAFPATTSGAMVAAAAPPAAPAANPPSAAVGASAAMRQGVVSTPDAAMFSAIRGANVNALRAALARGANVNARDETGRRALQIARERNDAEIVKALESSGAK